MIKIAAFSNGEFVCGLGIVTKKHVYGFCWYPFPMFRRFERPRPISSMIHIRSGQPNA